MRNLSICGKKDISDDFVIIEIDSKNARTLRDFYEVLAKELHFPDYFGFNLDSLDELLNDLSWIEDKSLAIYFKNSPYFLVNERNESKIITLLDMLDATCEDWRWMEPDEEIDEDHEDYIPKKELCFCFDESEYIDDILNKLS